jgi:hypothetical protein
MSDDTKARELADNDARRKLAQWLNYYVELVPLLAAHDAELIAATLRTAAQKTRQMAADGVPRSYADIENEILALTPTRIRASEAEREEGLEAAVEEGMWHQIEKYFRGVLLPADYKGTSIEQLEEDVRLERERVIVERSARLVAGAVLAESEWWQRQGTQTVDVVKAMYERLAHNRAKAKGDNK